MRFFSFLLFYCASVIFYPAFMNSFSAYFVAAGIIVTQSISQCVCVCFVLAFYHAYCSTAYFDDAAAMRRVNINNGLAEKSGLETNKQAAKTQQ